MVSSLRVKESCYDRISKFQKLLASRGIENHVSTNEGLSMEIRESDLKEVLRLAEKNRIRFYR
jgi:hypothetical protein